MHERKPRHDSLSMDYRCQLAPPRNLDGLCLKPRSTPPRRPKPDVVSEDLDAFDSAAVADRGVERVAALEDPFGEIVVDGGVPVSNLGTRRKGVSDGEQGEGRRD